MTDNLFKAGKYEELKDRLSIIRDHGMPVGLGTHMPEVVRYAQEHDWGVDFYVTSVYNLSLEQDRVSSAITGKANTGERFEEEDIPVMYRTVRSVDKPCLVFKILGHPAAATVRNPCAMPLVRPLRTSRTPTPWSWACIPRTKTSLYTRQAIERAEKLRKMKLKQ